MSSARRTKKLLAYVGMPALFCVLGYALLFVALQPVMGLATAMVGMLVSDQAPNFDSSLTSVYDPNNTGAEVQEAGYIDSYDIDFPRSGEHYGQLVCAEIGLDCPVYWYDSDDILVYGAGQSLISLPPGFGSAIVLCGHANTFFACLEHASIGNVITFKTNYCDYEYTVTDIQIYDENELESIITSAAVDETHEQLIMYTCYPFGVTSGRKTQRFTVFGERTKGIDVHWRASHDE